MTVVHSSAVIADTESESGVVDLTGRCMVAIHMPDGWDAAGLSLLAAETETGDFSPVHDDTGEVEWTIAADQVLIVNADLTRGLRWIKLRSGNTATPVAQTADRTLSVASIEDDRC